jgi:MFS superfamily sulfate permease-like transporter/CRP-like cAMP-binding protein
MTPAKPVGDWRHEVVGGITAAIAGLPIELNYGLIAVAPLGAAYASLGIMAAIYAAVVAGFVAALAGGRGAMISGSRPALMLIVASLVTVLMRDPAFLRNGVPDVALILVFVFCAVFLAGLLQLSFGILRLGRVITFIPQPVLAGFAAGVALSMLLFALKTSLGLATDSSLLDWFRHSELLRPWSIPVMLVTAFVMMHPPRAAKAVPPVLAAMVVGILLHETIRYVLGESSLSSRVSLIDGGLPHFQVLDVVRALSVDDLWRHLPLLLPYSAAIALLASLETLLSATTADLLTNERHNPDRELLAQGAGNMAAACFGGTPSAVSASRVVANISAGGRGRISSMVYALFMLALVVLVPHWFAYLPIAVIGGILLVFAASMIDDWQRRLLRQMLIERAGLSGVQRRDLTANAVIMILVAVVTVAGNLMQAIALGVAASLFIFVRSHARGVVRGVYSGVERHSLKVRHPDDARFLELNGERIGIVDVDGALFFGSADRLARSVERLAERAEIVVIDMRRVADIDSTGVRILQQLVRRLAGRKRRLLLASLRPGSRVIEALGTYQLEVALPRTFWFSDLDAALEAAEEMLLAERGDLVAAMRSFELAETDVAASLDAHGLALLAENLVSHSFAAGDYIFRHGDAGDSLFVITCGSVGIWLQMEDQHLRRITAFGAGVSFGEMALIDGQLRSADAMADGDVTAFELKRAAFEVLLRSHPDVGGQILLNLSRGLSQRLRSTTDDLRAAVER